MNPARTFGSDLVGRTFTVYWVYLAGPIAGAALAVVIAFILRGSGGGKAGSGAAQGDLFTETYEFRQILSGQATHTTTARSATRRCGP
jgi:aquaporin Z